MYEWRCIESALSFHHVHSGKGTQILWLRSKHLPLPIEPSGQPYYYLKLLWFYYILFLLGAQVCHVEVRGQPIGVSFLLPLCRLQGLNSDHQAL